MPLNVDEIASGLQDGPKKEKLDMKMTFAVRPPAVSKSEKKVDFPKGFLWDQTPSNPNLYVTRLTNLTRAQVKTYSEWWAKKLGGESRVDDKNDEKFFITSERVDVVIERDDKFWYIKIGYVINDIKED